MPSQAELQQTILTLAEDAANANTPWGNDNCTGFVFTVAFEAGIPFFYYPGLTDSDGVDFKNDVGAYGDHPALGLLNDDLKNPSAPNQITGFVTPVTGPGGYFTESQLSAVHAIPIQAPYENNWTLVNGNANNFSVINNSVLADEPQPGDLFRGVVENIYGQLILHSGVVESYNASNNTIWLISNWEGSYISRDEFTLTNTYQPANPSVRFVLSNYATFYAPAGTGPEQISDQITAVPSSGEYATGKTISFTLTTSAPITVSGTPNLTLSDGETAQYTGGSGTTTLHFSYTVAPGDNVASLGITGFSAQGASLTDASGNAISFGTTTAQFAGLQIDTTLPVISVPSLIVNANAALTPLGISAPTDNFTSASGLKITVISAPSNGTVFLADGITPISVGEQLTTAQLVGLEFQPQSNISGQSSQFIFSVADQAGNVSTGDVELTVNATNTISGTLTGTNLVSAGTTKTIISAVFLDFENNGTPVHAVLENAGTLIIGAGGSVSGDGTAGDMVVNDQGGLFSIDAATFFQEMIPFENNGSLLIAPGNGNVAEFTSYLGFSGGSFTNGATGTVHIESGTFDVDRGGSSNASAFTVDAGATFLVTGAPNSPAFTFSGGTYSVNGTTEVGTGTQFGALTVASGTIVNAANAWIVNQRLDMSAATISGTFTDLQLNTGSGGGNADFILGTQNIFVSNLSAYDGFIVQTTGTITLTGSSIISDTSQFGDYSSTFQASTINNYGLLTLDREFVGPVSVFNNYGSVIADGGGLTGTTINNYSGATLSLSGGGLTETSINNAGLLQLDGSSDHVVINGLVTNTGTIEESGTIYFEGGLINHGTIEGSDSVSSQSSSLVLDSQTSASDVALASSGATASVTNDGMIDASTALVVDPQDTDNTVLTNSSIMIGTSGAAVELGTGNDHVILEPGSIIVGTVDGGLGTNTIELASGSGSGALNGLGSNFINFADLIVDAGATWGVSGTGISGLNVTNDGTIGVAGNELKLGAIVSDSGQVGQFGISDGGSLEVQSSISATQTIAFQGAGTVILDQPQEFSGTLSNYTNADQLELVSTAVNTATVSGATLTILLENDQTLTYNVSNSLSGSCGVIFDDAGDSFISGVAPPDVTPTISAPSSAQVQQNGSTAISSVSIGDSDAGTSQTITVQLSDSSGFLLVNSSANGGTTDVTGSGTTNLTIVGTLSQVNADLATLADQDSSTAADTITISANDGIQSATQKTIAVTVSASPPPDVAPTISAPTQLALQQSVSGSVSGVSIGDSDAGTSQTITVQLSDSHGLLSVNSAASGGTSNVTGSGTTGVTIVGMLSQVNADLATLSDRDSSIAADIITVSASDGIQSATQKSIAVSVVTGHVAPMVTAVSSVSVAEGQATTASSLVASVSNPSADTITPTIYIYEDEGGGSGYFTVNGVRQADEQWFYPLATDTVQYVGGSSPGTDTLHVGLYDYTTNTYSIANTAISATTTATTYIAPTVTTVPTVSVPEGQAITASSLVASVTNPSGDLITPTIYIYDDEGGGSGYFTVNGVRQADGQWFYPLSTDVVQYVGGSSPSTDTLEVGLYDYTTNSYSISSTAVSATTTLPTPTVYSDAVNIPIIALYQAALGRLPDPTGLQNWENIVLGGETITEIAGGFTNSTEFQAKYGDLSPTAFVTLLYENVLDRAPDPSGLANWTTYLTTGAMTQAQVLVGFAESTENLANYSGTNFVFNATGTDITITGDGTKILFAPTAGNNAITGGPGVDTLVFTGDYSNYTLTQNSDGSLTVTGAGVSDNITNVGYLQFTDQTVVAVDSNDTLIAALYQAALDRAPDVSGIKNWESIYVDDVPTAIKAEGPITALGQYVPSGYGASIAAGFIQSAEFQSTYGNLDANGFITLLYENILGRAPDPAGLANWTGELTSGAMTEAMVLVGIADSTENLAKYAGHSILIG